MRNTLLIFFCFSLVTRMHGRINWTLPCPGLRLRVFSYRKEHQLLGSKRGDYELSSLFLRCLGIWNNALHHQQSFIRKHTVAISYFVIHHPLSNLCSNRNDKERNEMRNIDIYFLLLWRVRKKSEWTWKNGFKTCIIISLRLLLQTNKVKMLIKLNKQGN